MINEAEEGMNRMIDLIKNTNTFKTGFKFTLKNDLILRRVRTKKGALCEIVEIDESDGEFPYKVEIQGYKFGWWYFSENEIIEHLIR